VWATNLKVVGIVLGTLALYTLIAFVFWLGGLAEKSTFVAPAEREGGGRRVGH